MAFICPVAIYITWRDDRVHGTVVTSYLYRLEK